MTVTAEHVQGGSHVVLFYENDKEMVAPVATRLAQGLHLGEAALIVATPVHSRAIVRGIAGFGVDVEAAHEAGRLVTVDAAETMGRFLVDSVVQPELFARVLDDLITGVATGERPVRLYGEMVAVLWEAGQVTAAMDLEALWNDLGTRLPFSLICAYRADSVRDDVTALRDLCGAHSAVLGPIPLPEPDREHPPSWVRLDRRDFAGIVLDPRAARRTTAEALCRSGWGDVADDAALVVAELATNAVVHARSAFSVTVWCAPSLVKVAVRDGSPTPPRLRDPVPTEPGGRGLRLVDALAVRWGTTVEHDGKVVWAELQPRRALVEVPESGISG